MSEPGYLTTGWGGNPEVECKLCQEGMPLKKYFDGTMRHFDGLMAWHPCVQRPAQPVPGDGVAKEKRDAELR